MMVEIKGQEIILNHYPFHFDKDDSRWQLFGHIGSEPDSFEDLMGSMVPNQFDVGMSNNDWAPVAFEVVKYRISQQARLYVKRNG
jgi:calcineurin-like phosphoesterase family protein